MLNDEQLTAKVRAVSAVRAAAAATAKPTTPKQTAADKPMTKERWAQITAWSERELAKRAERERAAADWLTVGAAKPVGADAATIPLVTRVVNTGGKFAVETVVDVAKIASDTVAKMQRSRTPQQVCH